MSDTAVIEKTKDSVSVKEPGNYRVIFHNDNVTTVDFVVYALCEVFLKSQAEAILLTTKVHQEGRAIVGTYTYEIASHKTEKTITLARSAHFPLQVTFEENE